jgi:NitT/TauT family transport system permease protein
MADLLTIAAATLVTILRILFLILAAIVIGWFLAYLSVRNRRFETAYVSLVNVFDSIPVIGFFPIVLIIFIQGIGGSLGVEIAADFLVFDAVAWNVWMGQYQAFKTVPEHLLDVSENYRFGGWGTLKNLYIPYSVPRITSNLFSVFADGFFYITVSEVFTVGTTTYQTFGIGTLITQFLKNGDLPDVYYSLFFIAIGVIVVTVIFRRLSRWSVAKYGVDTSYEIKRHTGRLYSTLRGSREALLRQTRTVSRSVSKITGRKTPESEDQGLLNHRMRLAKYLGSLVIAGVAMILIYYLYGVASGVSPAQWYDFFLDTPFLLYSMAIDYVRVGVITAAAVGVAITFGYVLSVHRRLSTALTPVVQTAAALPAPAYFPLIFIATIPFLASVMPYTYTEVYIFILGFLSCFHYVFFNFWTGVQTIPAEFLEVTRNNEIKFTTRMRRIILPATFPYLISGLSSTINNTWAGIALGEYWPNIYGNLSLVANVGMMKLIGTNLANGNIPYVAWISIIFAVVVFIYGIVFTRNMMNLARKRYVVEEGIYMA